MHAAKVKDNEFRVHSSRSVERIRNRSVVDVKWIAPPVGIWKIHVDGAFSHPTRLEGVSIVIRDSFGNMAARGAVPLRGILSAENNGGGTYYIRFCMSNLCSCWCCVMEFVFSRKVQVPGPNFDPSSKHTAFMALR